MQYTLVSADTGASPNVEAVLVSKVNQLIQSGWEPIGGVSLVTYRDGYGQEQLICYQAMIKRD